MLNMTGDVLMAVASTAAEQSIGGLNNVQLEKIANVVNSKKTTKLPHLLPDKNCLY